VTDAVWWPADADDFWPPGVPDQLTVTAFVIALATVGYATCANETFEPGFEKVAVYERAGVPTHAARQLADGRWSSKLGRDCLVSHTTPAGIEGAVYGFVTVILKRPVT